MAEVLSRSEFPAELEVRLSVRSAPCSAPAPSRRRCTPSRRAGSGSADDRFRRLAEARCEPVSFRFAPLADLPAGPIYHCMRPQSEFWPQARFVLARYNCAAARRSPRRTETGEGSYGPSLMAINDHATAAGLNIRVSSVKNLGRTLIAALRLPPL